MLRMEIDNTWDCADFIDVLESVESMYYKCLASDEFMYLGPHWPLSVVPFNRVASEHLDAINRQLLGFARYSADSQDRLGVKRISYASPGSIDLIGVGRAVDAVARTIERLITFWEERHIRHERSMQAQIETEHKRETLRSLQIKNAREMLKLQKEYPRAAKDLLLPLLVRDQERLSERISERKITKIKQSAD